jgi:hypothetical protein
VRDSLTLKHFAMFHIWASSRDARPLAERSNDASTSKVREIASTLVDFYETYPYFIQILQLNETSIESLHDFHQLWDECDDFCYDYDDIQKHRKSFAKRQPKLSTISFGGARYVYTNEDVERLETRAVSQLRIMQAKMDDIIL